MRFTVPKFIEKETKILGPLTLKQSIIIGIGGAICFILRFMVPFRIFLLSCIVIGGGAFAFAFLRIKGFTLPEIVINFLRFTVLPKAYLWKKKKASLEVFEGEKIFAKKKSEEEGLPLKIAEKSRLKRIKTQIETKTK